MEKTKQNFKYYFLALLVLATGLVWYAVLEESNNKLRVAFLDVGQGDAIFIEAPNGNQVLIDGGPNSAVLRELSKMMPFYDRSINMVIMTHPDGDHVNGLVDVLRRYKIEAFVDSGFKTENPAYKEAEDLVASKNIKDLDLIKGYRINLDKDLYLDILSPPISAENLDDNNGSVVARLVYGNNSFMLTGDMEQKMENYLISTYGEKLKSDVLKIGHHGSRTSTSQAFLGFVSPSYGIISVGADNRYGHPHKETLDLLNLFKATVLRTDEKGMIEFESDGGNLEFKTSR